MKIKIVTKNAHKPILISEPTSTDELVIFITITANHIGRRASPYWWDVVLNDGELVQWSPICQTATTGGHCRKLMAALSCYNPESALYSLLAIAQNTISNFRGNGPFWTLGISNFEFSGQIALGNWTCPQMGESPHFQRAEECVEWPLVLQKIMTRADKNPPE